MPWNPEQYHKFKNERFAPFNDLLAPLRGPTGSWDLLFSHAAIHNGLDIVP